MISGSLRKGTRKANMNQVTSYEITFIVKEDQKTDDIKKILAEHSAKIISENDLGSRTLSYEIKKATQGHYFRIVFECNKETIKKIEKDLQRQKSVLRYLIVMALRKPKATGERRLPQPSAESNVVAPREKTEVKSAKDPAAKIVEPAEEAKIEPTPVAPAQPKKEEPKAKKAEGEKKTRKTIRKATKAEASELDKKLEELVKED